MKVISGGQTGVDRAALDAALELGIAHGGTVPKGRVAEDGRVPAKYDLQECDSSDYAVRTELNVLNSEATLILTRGKPEGGVKLTEWLTRKHKKPAEVVDLGEVESEEEASRKILQFLRETGPEVLNVAGPRESRCPGIHAAALGLLKRALADYLSLPSGSGRPQLKPPHLALSP